MQKSCVRRAVSYTHLNTLLGAHHYRLQHITFFELSARNCVFDGDLDDVAYACVATVRATQNLDTQMCIRESL